MINTNFNSPAFKAQQAKQVAFKGSEDFSPGKGAASAFIPGTGQAVKGEYGKAALHLGVFGGTIAGVAKIGKEIATKAPGATSIANLIDAGVKHPKLKVAFVLAAPLVLVGTAIYSALDAFKPKASSEE